MTIPVLAILTAVLATAQEFAISPGYTLPTLDLADHKHRQVVIDREEGQSWSAPRELSGSLTGDRHTGRYAPAEGR